MVGGPCVGTERYTWEEGQVMGGQVSGDGLQLGSGPEDTVEGREGSRTQACALSVSHSLQLFGLRPLK